MSGGSYDYLFRGDFDAHHGQLVRMGERLLSLGYPDAASVTFWFAAEPDERLREIWRSVEWLDSNDSGIEEVKKAIREWGGESD